LVGNGIGMGETILDISAAPVPEPSTYALLIGSIGALILFRRRKTQTTL
jgi:hypothetical protein